MMNGNYKHSHLTEKILKAYYNVYDKLGYGFQEKIYENAMMIELKKLGLNCEKQKPIDVYYYEQKVGEYFPNIVVEENIIIEIKADESLKPEYENKLVNYLKATEIEVGVLLNFGKDPELGKVFKKKYNNNN